MFLITKKFDEDFSKVSVSQGWQSNSLPCPVRIAMSRFFGFDFNLILAFRGLSKVADGIAQCVTQLRQTFGSVKDNKVTRIIYLTPGL